MADIDWPAFAAVLRDRVKASGLTFKALCDLHPGLNKATLSRATRGQMVGAGNYLMLCRVFSIGAHAFVVAAEADHAGFGRSGRAEQNQCVSPDVSREAGAVGRGEAA